MPEITLKTLSGEEYTVPMCDELIAMLAEGPEVCTRLVRWNGRYFSNYYGGSRFQEVTGFFDFDGDRPNGE